MANKSTAMLRKRTMAGIERTADLLQLVRFNNVCTKLRQVKQNLKKTAAPE
jgi:hypothetical protein